MAKTFEQFLRTLPQEKQTVIEQKAERLTVEEMTLQELYQAHTKIQSGEDTDELRAEYSFRGNITVNQEEFVNLIEANS